VDVPIKCGDVMVNPGDYIFGDADGVVVIPKYALEEVLRKAIEKVEQESTMREELRAGISVAEAFRRHGIL
jgi:regulator of RNase E activity RraA